ncbi:hypothetical protein BKA59DRAFT_508073 [Fusarium tricinctum]|uniref:SNF2 N-terminal domain-containing protein n=1 Tax=Fusarium tricinctum TaxID=61284 RepID=A0A8K0S9L1_9HYPO|nr:hypothetical protein BKA59DRAFT_508073 [Fusarium tricinctum]
MILANATSLRKSLTALVAAFQNRKQILPHCGPILIVTRPRCAHQWLEETKAHFGEESRLKATIVDRHDVDTDTLLEREVLVCTSSFLKA